MSARLLVVAWLLTLGGFAAVVVWLLVPPEGRPPPAVVVTVPALVMPLPPAAPAAPVPSTPAPIYPPPPAAPVAGHAAEDTPPAPTDPVLQPGPEQPGPVPPAAEPPASVPHADVSEPHAAPEPASDAPVDAGSPAQPRGRDVALPEVPATDVPPPGGERTPDDGEPPVPAPTEPPPPEPTPPVPAAPMPPASTPRVDAAGGSPRHAYARPFEAPPDRPRIAVVIGNLGLAAAATDAAIRDLPGAVTLSFAPDADHLDDRVSEARARGHEVLLDLPMEPEAYPRWDPGPMALFTHLDAAENLSRLDWIMGRTTGYTGFVNQMGSRFTTAEESLRPILIALRDRGLLFVDSRSAADSKAATIASEIGLPRAVNDRFIDRDPSRDAILGRLAELERIARDVGAALGIGYASAATIDVVRAWVPETQRRGFALAPVSAVVDRQPDR